MRLSVFILFLCSNLSSWGQNVAFDVQRSPERRSYLSPIRVVAQIPAADGGRFVVSSTNAPDLPLENPSQFIHSGSSIAVSEDAGQSFRVIEVPGLLQVDSIAFGTRSAGLRYALGDGQSIAVTRDGGISWQSYLAPFRVGVAFVPDLDARGSFWERAALLLDPREESIVYRVSSGYSGLRVTPILRWREDLASFLPVANGLPPMALGPYLRPGATELFAADADKIYRNPLPGGNWELYAQLPAGTQIRDVAFDQLSTRRLWVLSMQGQVWRSNDNGLTWQLQVAQGVARMAAHPQRPGHVVFYGTQSSFVSIDGGVTLLPAASPWPANPLLGTGPQDLEFDALQVDTLYADGRRKISRDAGRTWTANTPKRIGRRICSPLEPAKCYALDQRYENFYVEKFNAGGDLEWSTYWGDDDDAPPLAAAVDTEGELWLSTARKMVRILPDGSLRLVQALPQPLQSFVFTPDSSLLAVLPPRPASPNSRLALLDRNSLSPLPSAEISIPAEVLDFSLRDGRVAFLTRDFVGIWPLRAAAFETLPTEADFVAHSLAWLAPGRLLLAGSRRKDASGDSTRAEVLEWNANSYRVLASLSGEANDFADKVLVDAIGRIWITGWTSSQRFPLRLPLWSGPARGEGLPFLALLGNDPALPAFATHLPRRVNALAGRDVLDLVAPLPFAAKSRASFGAGSLSNRFFDESPLAYQPLRLRLASIQPPLRIASVEKRFDRSGGHWSRNAWLRLRSEDLQRLEAFQLPLSEPNGRTEAGTFRVLLDGESLPIIAGGPGFLDVVLTTLTDSASPGLLTLSQGSRTSQALQLILDRSDYELLPRPDAPDLALAYNADGTENSEANPAAAGSQVTLFVAGGRESQQLELSIGDPVGAAQLSPGELGPGLLTDYLDDVPNALPGLRYAGYTLRGLRLVEGANKVGLFRALETEPSLYLWVKP